MNDAMSISTLQSSDSSSIVRELIRKDLYFNRGPLALYVIVGLIGIGLISVGHETTFYVGGLLLITAVIIIGAHLVYANVVQERNQQNLSLIMSLPISYRDYSVAKILANLGFFSVAWLVLLGTAVIVILAREGLPNGLIPFTVILLLELFAAFVLVFAVAMITESEAWTTVIMTLTNICVSLFMYGINKIESIQQYIDGQEAVWSGAALTVIGIEIAVIALLVSITLWAQSRKHDYL